MTAWGKPANFAMSFGQERALQAQVRMIATSMPAAAWLNPTWALLATVPFLGFFPMFGHLEPWRLVVAVLLHVAAAPVAILLYFFYRRDPSNSRAWFRVFTVFQAVVGASWGAMVWLLWVPGNSLNHILVVWPVLGLLWTYAASRTTRLGLYLAGVLPMFALTLARFALGTTETAAAVALIFCITFLYTLVIALGSRRMTDNIMWANFANEDLTAELRAARDEALRKCYEAEAANASKTTFLANMSHELRTPLNAILGFSEIIGTEAFGICGVPRYCDYARDIHASGSHLLSIINDILDIAKIESGRMAIEPVLLTPNRLIDNALRVVAPRAREKDQKLSVDLEPAANEVYADERAFKQILINLVTNAVKYTQNGGAITVHGMQTPEGGFELVVEDNGPGIEASLLDRVFQPFNQVDNRYNRQEGGTGLGLSLVRGLAALHGGQAWIDTEYGTGARVHVYFPSKKVARTQELVRETA